MIDPRIYEMFRDIGRDLRSSERLLGDLLPEGALWRR